MKFIIQVFSNALAVVVAAYLLPGFSFNGSLTLLILTGAAMGLVNFFVRPLIRFITAPLVWLSLGLFSIVINAFLLWIVDLIIPALEIQGIVTYILAVLIIGLVNFIIDLLSKPLLKKNLASE